MLFFDPIFKGKAAFGGAREQSWWSRQRNVQGVFLGLCFIIAAGYAATIAMAFHQYGEADPMRNHVLAFGTAWCAIICGIIGQRAVEQEKSTKHRISFLDAAYLHVFGPVRVTSIL